MFSVAIGTAHGYALADYGRGQLVYTRCLLSTDGERMLRAQTPLTHMQTWPRTLPAHSMVQ